MTQMSYPFANSPILTVEQWSKAARHWLTTGVLLNEGNKLEVYGDSTGMQVKVKSGVAWIQGHYYESDTLEVLGIGTADSTNPRIDRVILRLDWATGTILLAVIQGSPAVSPVAPALTQNTARWEIPLAQVRVEAGALTIAADKVGSERPFVKNVNALQENWYTLVLQNGWNGTGNGDAEPRYMKDEFGFVHLKGSIWGGTSADWTIIANLPVGYYPSERIRIPTVSTDNGSNIVPAYIIIEPDGTVKIKNVTYNSYLELNIAPFRV